jgi:hypothetical protein
MQVDNDSEGHNQEVLGEKARRAGARHMVLGFVMLLILLFMVSWCALPSP